MSLLSDLTETPAQRSAATFAPFLDAGTCVVGLQP